MLECSPPMTPANPIAPEASQIINSSPVNLRSTPSKVLNKVPAGKLSTINLPPLISCQSYACIGCPKPWQMKLVMSTTLLIGRKPIAARRSCNQEGDGATWMPSSVIPQKRSQPASLISTAMGCALLSITNAGEGNWIGSPVTALISRATPQWEAASARFGVKPISNTKSPAMSKNEAAGVPLGTWVSKTKIPSCEVPIPISSSAQIIPSEGCP